MTNKTLKQKERILIRSITDLSIRTKKEIRQLSKICRLAIKEEFPLDEFFLWEIPSTTGNCSVFCFFGKEWTKNKDQFRQIDFWVYKRKNKYHVKPASEDEPKKTCIDALYESE